MANSSLAIANSFLELADGERKILTNMQLQKLVFLAQGYCLALLDRPLHYHNTYAWQWGPVIPRLYKQLQKYGSGFVAERLHAEDELQKDSEEHEVVKSVFNNYKNYTGSQLSGLTHQPHTPWSVTWEKQPFGIIDTELLAKYYREKIEQA